MATPTKAVGIPGVSFELSFGTGQGGSFSYPSVARTLGMVEVGHEVTEEVDEVALYELVRQRPFLFKTL